MSIYKVYKITNRLNGKIYVGQTKQAIEKRFMQHLHANSPLGQAMRQFGAENFTIEVIEECETQAQVNERERFWIKVLNCKVPNGYNVREGGFCFVHKPMIRNGIAESLKNFRQDYRLTQKQVAETIGILPAAFAQYESPFKGGKPVSPSIDLVIKIARAFNVSIDYLAGLTDDPTPHWKKFDASAIIEKPASKLTLESLHAEFEELKARVEKLESSK